MPPKSKPKKPKPLILPTPSNPTPSEFSTAVATTAVAQICHSAGYSLTRLSALEALTAVAISYLTSLAAASAAYASRANRTDANLIDFANAIHDMSFIKGFPGAAELHRSCAVMQSGVLKELRMFVDRTVETPFAWPIPRRRREALEDRVARNVGSGMRHVPRWLPGFPEVGEAKRAKRRKGEELWEVMVSENVVNNVGNENVGIDGDNREVVGVKSKRERVRFKIGVVKMRRMEFAEEGKNKCWNWNSNNVNNLGIEDSNL